MYDALILKKYFFIRSRECCSLVYYRLDYIFSVCSNIFILPVICVCRSRAYYFIPYKCMYKLNSLNKKDKIITHVIDTNCKQLYIISKIKMEHYFIFNRKWKKEKDKEKSFAMDYCSSVYCLAEYKILK